MTVLAARIQAIDPAQAEAKYRVSSKHAVEVPINRETVALLSEEAEITSSAGVTSGEVARAALLFLTEDPTLQGPLSAMLDNPPAESLTDPAFHAPSALLPWW